MNFLKHRRHQSRFLDLGLQIPPLLACSVNSAEARSLTVSITRQCGTATMHNRLLSLMVFKWEKIASSSTLSIN
jgi:hypothetical protein